MKTWMLILFCWLCLPFYAYSNSDLYISIDLHGNKHYSDKAPLDNNYQIEKQPALITTKMIKAPKIISSNSNTNNKKLSNSTNELSSNEQCNQKKILIKKLENQLKQTLKSRVFDTVKNKLSNLRWQYRKTCY